jgi:hypothetical protein
VIINLTKIQNVALKKTQQNVRKGWLIGCPQEHAEAGLAGHSLEHVEARLAGRPLEKWRASGGGALRPSPRGHEGRGTDLPLERTKAGVSATSLVHFLRIGLA